MKDFLAGVFAGGVVGVVGTLVTFLYAFNLAARYLKTGSTKEPVQVEPAHKLTAPSPEASANRRITEDAIKKGADQLMEAAKDAGRPMQRSQAEREARELIQMAHPLGGAG